MMSDLVSIIVPCRNAGPFLGAALQSAVEQTWQNKEVIFVDDGSSDNSLEIATRFSKQGVHIIQQEPRGASAARNRGLQAARGGWIQFLDADDILHPEKIAAQIDRLTTQEPGKIASGVWSHFDGSNLNEPIEPLPIHRDLSGIEFLLLHFQSGCMMQPAAWLAPRSLLDAIGPWDEELSLNDDGEYFGRAVLASTGIIHCARARSYYRSHAGERLSRRSDAIAMQSLWRSSGMTLDRLAARIDQSEDVRTILAGAWMTLAYEFYPELPELAARAESRALEYRVGRPLHRMPGRFRSVARLIGWRAARRLQIKFGRS